jgi:hypothetical protein
MILYSILTSDVVVESAIFSILKKRTFTSSRATMRTTIVFVLLATAYAHDHLRRDSHVLEDIVADLSSRMEAMEKEL